MRKTIIKISLIVISIILLLQIPCFAAVDQAHLFLSKDFENDASAVQAMMHSVSTCRTLGYDIQGGISIIIPFSITDSKTPVLNYISGTGDNYAFLVSSHGNSSLFCMKNGDPSSYIYPSDISGAWHFVFLDSCSSLADDDFAQAFRTVGYSNRATLGWFDTVNTSASAEWWSYFKNAVGTTNLHFFYTYRQYFYINIFLNYFQKYYPYIRI